MQRVTSTNSVSMNPGITLENRYVPHHCLPRSPALQPPSHRPLVSRATRRLSVTPAATAAVPTGRRSEVFGSASREGSARWRLARHKAVMWRRGCASVVQRRGCA